MIDFIEDVMQNGDNFRAVIWDKSHMYCAVEVGSTGALALASLMCHIHRFGKAGSYDWKSLQIVRTNRKPVNQPQGIFTGGHFLPSEYTRLQGNWDLH